MIVTTLLHTWRERRRQALLLEAREAARLELAAEVGTVLHLGAQPTRNLTEAELQWLDPHPLLNVTPEHLHAITRWLVGEGGTSGVGGVLP